ncbi:mitochondrial fission protein ELM1-like protein [Pavlovales sp. CCMP2436]|nr:mitochondrial fission protein ELM1-like protein [Pavlovales sp. CCMP2436]|mmetsp:Transcript_15047/g.38194  ORF Transcript_15047/g.38194 Transcript_15047/m.38194 type:complete len:422 (-) Transcript_15047:65-1330(-)
MTAAHLVILANGSVGAEKQALALAGASGLPFRVLRLLPHPLLARAPTSAQLLAARALGASRRALFDPASAPALDALLGEPPPAFAVSCGRASILASVCARTLGAKTVHIQRPRCGECEFDRLVVPAHDLTFSTRYQTPGNALLSTGSLHAIDAAVLEAARESAEGAALLRRPSPRVALLLGGPTPACAYTPEDAVHTLHHAHASTRRAGGSLLVSTSRRSPAELVRAVAALAAADPQHVSAWLAQTHGAAGPSPSADYGAPNYSSAFGSNPYEAFLTTAEHLVVTADSVNMATEAVAAAHFTGARVHIALAEACRSRDSWTGWQLGNNVSHHRNHNTAQFWADWSPLQLRTRGARRRLRAFLDSLLDVGAAQPFAAELPFELGPGDGTGEAGRALQLEIATQTKRIARSLFGPITTLRRHL